MTRLFSRLPALLLAPLLLAGTPAGAETVLRIGMTASDIPLTTGQPDQGGEGQRTTGYTIYDALVNWDLSSADKPAVLTPGLATEWKVDEADKTKWIFKIRPGVKFHDGSTFTAAAAVWNFEKLLNDKSPQFDAKQSAQGRSRIPAIASSRAIDDNTLEITTKAPESLLPYQLSWILMSSPTQWEKVGKDWDKFAYDPSGTGPWKVAKFVPRERVEMVKYDGYWDKARVPKTDRLVFLPLPEAATRTAALLSGQVDWIEAPAPDAVPRLKQSGMQVVSNAFPHNWTWHLSRVEGSPWNDIRVRKAANLAIDRDGMKELLGGLALPSKGFLPPGSQWFGKPTFDVKYDPAEAKKLLAEAGFSKEKPLTVKAIISPSGSGQMQPLPMNEYVQQNLADVGIKVDFEVIEWNTMINVWRAGAKSDTAKGGQSVNFTYSLQDPFLALVRHLDSKLVSPAGTNWGYYSDPEMDGYFKEVSSTFDEAKRDEILRKVHEKFVNEALFLMVVHDVAPRAMSPKVTNFVQAQSWYLDFSSIVMK